MNILCKIKGHQFKPDSSRGATWENNGNCVIFTWCERCGERHEQPTGTPHTFAIKGQKTEYQCEDLESHHSCWKIVTNTCTTCGYVRKEKTTVLHFDKDKRLHRGCTNVKICPNCKKTFDLKDQPHQYDQIIGIESGPMNCHQVMQCSQCGIKSSACGQDVLLPHAWSEYTVVSACERFRTCARCGQKEEILTHQWQRDGKARDHKSHEIAGGDAYSWEESQVCTVCKKRRTVTLHDFPSY